MKSLLVIAGTDSSGGAGLTRDAQVAHEFGFQVKPVVTGVSAQTDDALEMKNLLSPAIVRAQIRAAFETQPPVAIKIGMLGRDAIVEAVCEVLVSLLDEKEIPIVLDPVLKTSSGGVLFSGEYLQKLFPLVRLVTPNLDEAAVLSDCAKAVCEQDIAMQGEKLRAKGARAVLIKGGHGQGAFCTDHLFEASEHRLFEAPRLARTRRGTGCALASAIACHLGKGQTLGEACEHSIAYLRAWIARPSEDF